MLDFISNYFPWPGLWHDFKYIMFLGGKFVLICEMYTLLFRILFSTNVLKNTPQKFLFIRVIFAKQRANKNLAAGDYLILSREGNQVKSQSKVIASAAKLVISKSPYTNWL
jgi:hypothetical protein